MNPIELKAGDVYGRLTVLRMVKINGRRTWECRCRCGEVVRQGSWVLRSGSVQSCGCQKIEKVVARCTTHGLSHLPEHKLWENMISRCECKNTPYYKHYGGRGIKVCDRWRRSFPAFLEDVGRRPSPKHEVDRFPNNDGNYEPGNVRWATRSQQLRNTRRTPMLTIGGETKPISDWADESGIHPATIRYRVSVGWSPWRAVFDPPLTDHSSRKKEEPK